MSGKLRREPIRVLLVDDERSLTDALEEYLSLRGFETRAASGGRPMREILSSWEADIIVLDVNLGRGEDGFSLAGWIGTSYAPEKMPAILFLSGQAGPVERVLGLELGADDYLAKPIIPRELVARINGIAARRGLTSPARGIMRIGNLGIDIDRQVILSSEGDETALAPGEFALLKCFLDQPDRVFSREDLLDRAPASDDGVADRAIDRRINRLRAKLGPDGDNIITSIRGQGYRLGSSR